MANLHINLLIKAKTPGKIYNICLFLNKKNKLNKSSPIKQLKEVSKTLFRTPITHALHVITKRNTILTAVRLLYFLQRYIIAFFHGIPLGNLLLQ